MHKPQKPLSGRWMQSGLWMQLLLLSATALLGTAAAPGQAEVVRPLSGDDKLRAQQIEFERQDGRVVQVRWGKHEIPMVPPAANLACGLSSDGEHLVLLANGVRDSLDFYFVGKKGGDFYRFQTDGGRRLRRDFNAGQGSWPWIEGSHLILFGYEKASKLEFRAVARSGQVHANRKLSLGLKGFEVDADPDRGYVRVRFAGVGEPLEFHHPLSPRLELVNGLLEFGIVKLGSSSRRLLNLRNSGKRKLTLRLLLSSAQFELDADEALERQLQPGERSRIAVIFKPRAAGRPEARMKLLASGSIPELLVVLRGEAQAPTKGPAAAIASKPTTRPGPGRSRPKKLAPPSLLAHRVHPLGGGEVLLLGHIATGETQQRRLSLRNTQSRAEVSALADPRGRFHARLRAADFVGIEVAAADGPRRSPWIEFGQVQPQLENTGGDLIVRCLPDQQFLLLAVPLGEPGKGAPSPEKAAAAHSSARILGSWRGRAGSSGLVRYPLSFLGAHKAKRPPLALVLVTEVLGEKRASARLRIR